MASKQILIVEDDSIIGWHLERSLSDLGYHVAGVLDTGESAIAAAVSNPPDLALMDIGLKGGMDGVETAWLLRHQLNVPVVFLTAYTDPVTLERAKQTEPYGYLRKPFDDQALRATIEMALHKHQLETQLKESEKRYRLLFSTMYEAFALHEIILDEFGDPINYRFLDVNAKFEQMTGLAAADVVGKTVLEVLPGIESSWIETYGQVAKTGVPLTFENYTQTLDKFFQVMVFSPSPGQFATLFFDVTETKQMEMSLRASENRLRTLTAAATSFIFELDSKGIIRFANKPYPGVQLTDMLGSALVRWFPEPIRSVVEELVDRVFREGQEESFEYILPNEAQESRSYIAQMIPVQGEGGIQIAVMTTTDFTDQEKAERALADERALLARRVEERTSDLSIANAQLARAVRMKDEFLASMSHELRTPLTGILGLSEALQKNLYGEVNERQQQALTNIGESGAHLLSLINDILDLSKIEAGRLDLEISPVSIGAVCRSSVRLVSQAAQKKNITILLRNSAADENIMADERRVKQVLVNLLSNAVKFTPDKGQVELVVHLDQERGALLFMVTDTGIGIQQSELKQLFQPFVQLDAGLSRAYPGTGLGLSLVLKLVELHGGGVSVESEPGKGSQFTVLLPWKPVSNESIRVWAQRKQDEAQRQQPFTHSILVIDDDNSPSMQMIHRSLYQQQCEVHACHPDENAVDSACNVLANLIFINVAQPGRDGWEVLDQLQADDRTRLIPVVVVSAQEDRVRAMSSGAMDSLTFPFSDQQVAEILRKMMVGRGIDVDRHPRVTQLDGKVVLIAEDNDLVRNTVTDYLLAQGCLVIPAQNGTEAIELTRERRPDVILMDIQMPVMDGIEAIRRIRDEKDSRAVAIIAVTALAMAGDRERCLNAGADFYMTKPFRLDSLRDVILSLGGGNG